MILRYQGFLKNRREANAYYGEEIAWKGQALRGLKLDELQIDSLVKSKQEIDMLIEFLEEAKLSFEEVNDQGKTPKFKRGDKVKVVNHGHFIWMREGEDKSGKVKWFDGRSDIVGKEGVISEVGLSQNLWQYAVEGIPGKYAWYTEDQLELVKP